MIVSPTSVSAGDMLPISIRDIMISFLKYSSDCLEVLSAPTMLLSPSALSKGVGALGGNTEMGAHIKGYVLARFLLKSHVSGGISLGHWQRCPSVGGHACTFRSSSC